MYDHVGSNGTKARQPRSSKGQRSEVPRSITPQVYFLYQSSLKSLAVAGWHKSFRGALMRVKRYKMSQKQSAGAVAELKRETP